MKKNFCKAITGFTLAEVLITLTIIGVVAALTIPSLITNIQNAQYVAKLKKDYSTLASAHRLLTQDYGTSGDISSHGSYSGDCQSANPWAEFKKYLNLAKNCGIGAYSGCWPDVMYKNLNGGNFYNPEAGSYYAKGILSDGSLIALNDLNGDCISDYGDGPLDNATCGAIVIDLNGAQGPNTMGRDVFLFVIARSGIFPAGAYSPTDSCFTNTSGQSCASKVLREGAINY